MFVMQQTGTLGVADLIIDWGVCGCNRPLASTLLQQLDFSGFLRKIQFHHLPAGQT